MRADLPPDEEARLNALRDLDVLDSEPEEAFDELVRRAAEATGAPVAVITLVDEARQWFKARVNLELEATDRDLSFCAHAILQPGDVTVVPDTLEDTRFADNLLVTEDPNIRFYAGAPVTTATGYPVGTICVIDSAPRGLSEEQADALRALAREVSTQLEQRRIRRAQARAGRDGP
jgi:GAF domain-containing protein